MFYTVELFHVVKSAWVGKRRGPGEMLSANNHAHEGGIRQTDLQVIKCVESLVPRGR